MPEPGPASWLDEGCMGSLGRMVAGAAQQKLDRPTEADELDLGLVLGKVFSLADLQQLHATATAVGESVNGKGSLAARGVHSPAWTTLITALAIATERARFPARVVVLDGAGAGEPYQVFLAGTDVALEVTVLPDEGGQGYRSTVVPPGMGFELGKLDLPFTTCTTWPPQLELRLAGSPG